MSVKVRSKDLSTGEKSLYLDIYQSGKREKRVLDLRLTGDKANDKEMMKLAEAVRAKTEMEIFSGAHGLISVNKGKITLYDYCLSKQKNLKKSLIVRLTRHIAILNTTIQIKNVDAKFLDEFIAYLKSAGLSDTTRNLYFTGLSTILNTAVRERVILENPCKLVRRERVSKKMKTALTFDEIQALSDTEILGEDGLGGEIKRAFLFACYTGLRWSDCKALVWGDIKDKQIAIYQTKTKDPVYVPLCQSAIELIETQEQHIHLKDEAIFKLTPQFAGRYIRLWAKKAGIEKHISFHTSRHSFVTNLHNTGASVYTASKLAGHSKMAMTENYMHENDSLKRQAVDALPALKSTKRA
jgi:integrase